MTALEHKISRDLEKQSFSVVPESELRRVWPGEGSLFFRIERFAIEHDWRLFSYSRGLGAILISKSLPKAAPATDL